MQELALSIGEPFTSPRWGSNFVMFSGDPGAVISEQKSKEYLRRTCKYARLHEVYLIPERFELLGYQCMCLISPQGNVLGAQKATHLFLPPVSGYKRGLTIEVFNTEFGGIFLCVDVDIYHPEIIRIAAEMGAQYVFCAQQMARNDYSSSMVISGIWNAAQSNTVYGISVSSQFHCVCAPIALTKNNDGFIIKPTLKTPTSIQLHAENLSGCKKRRLLNRKLFATHRAELIGK